jgi:hypothetical protein
VLVPVLAAALFGYSWSRPKPAPVTTVAAIGSPTLTPATSLPPPPAARPAAIRPAAGKWKPPARKAPSSTDGRAGGSGGTPAGGSGCPLFPANNVWHARVDQLPVLAASASYVASIGASQHLHPDFGSGSIDGQPFGIPITEVPAGQPGVRVTFDYDDESDAGPYPLAPNARIEGGPASDGDRHVILHDAANCRLYELFAARRTGSSWTAQSGAIWNLRSNTLRPAGWTSADAAGLPIMAGLVRYEEVATGRIDHAIRITVPRSRDSYQWPARHAAGSSGASLPPMGLRLRLKASVNVAGLPAQARVIATAMKTYGVVVADNGSAWYLTGTEDNRWNNDALDALKGLTGSQFEAVDTAGLMASPNSGAVR